MCFAASSTGCLWTKGRSPFSSLPPTLNNLSSINRLCLVSLFVSIKGFYCSTVASERSDKSNFPIKCIYNLNFFNRKTIKYSQMLTIYLFIRIFTYIYSNYSKWPPSESMQREARFLLCRSIFLKASSSMFSANLLTRRRQGRNFTGSEWNNAPLKKAVTPSSELHTYIAISIYIPFIYLLDRVYE